VFRAERGGLSPPARRRARSGASRSGRGRYGQDQQVDDSHLGEPVTATSRAPAGPLAPSPRCGPGRVAADQPERSLSERSLSSGGIVLLLLLDDAVEHGISAGRFGRSAFVIFAKPAPMSANVSNSCLSGSHSSELVAAVSEASGAITRGTGGARPVPARRKGAGVTATNPCRTGHGLHCRRPRRAHATGALGSLLGTRTFGGVAAL
jgi:hypothetical protein